MAREKTRMGRCEYHKDQDHAPVGPERRIPGFGVGFMCNACYERIQYEERVLNRGGSVKARFTVDGPPHW